MSELGSAGWPRLLRFLAGEGREPPRTLVVAAHPDDEVIGIGGQLGRLRSRVHVLHVTDGAPRDMRDAHAHGFATRHAYADARRRELLAALAEAGIGPERTFVFGLADQEAAQDLVAVTRRLAELLGWLRPESVVSPAYEGGHPDHDAAAFAAWAARALLRRGGQLAPEGVEYPLYHRGRHGMVTGHFLAGGPPALLVRLSPEDCALKRRMVSRFATQREVLAPFCLDAERFRATPERDFRKPPHQGALHYEQLPWGWTGARWREDAARALVELELGPVVPA